MEIDTLRHVVISAGGQVSLLHHLWPEGLEMMNDALYLVYKVDNTSGKDTAEAELLSDFVSKG